MVKKALDGRAFRRYTMLPDVIFDHRVNFVECVGEKL
jgi:hypothetical protein